ncbi:kinase-like domain-containing protein [Melampsora americana]|nr:kinase-like domain-containing protein [Melampsora americana]
MSYVGLKFWPVSMRGKRTGQSLTEDVSFDGYLCYLILSLFQAIRIPRDASNPLLDFTEHSSTNRSDDGRVWAIPHRTTLLDLPHSLGTTRFLKTIRARHKQGRIVVKVFVKTDPSYGLKAYLKRLKAERELLQGIPNVLTYQRSVETEKAGYLIRQWLANNLYDRISTRPFLSITEKKWIVFQLLTALSQSWKQGVAHGDIKSENVIVTSWNWVFLTDFSTAFKPTYLPEDDPADFSYFFDTSSRRSCYLAPERFFTVDKDTDGLDKANVTQSMDVFSLGCVIGELFMEGNSPFTLSQMFNYKSGEYDIEPYLRGIEDDRIRNLVRSMIQLNPEERLTFDEYLTDCQTNKTFPNSFYVFLHPFMLGLQELTSSLAPYTASRVASDNGAAMGEDTLRGEGFGRSSVLRNHSDEIIEMVWSDFSYASKYFWVNKKKKRTGGNEDMDDEPHPELDPSGNEAESTSKRTSRHTVADFPLQVHIPGYQADLQAKPTTLKSNTSDDVALIMLSLISSNIRNCSHPGTIVKALDLYLALSEYLTDIIILDRIIPYPY